MYPYDEQRVAFVTSAWERDWLVVLEPERFAAQVAASRHPFSYRLIVLNNFSSSKTRQQARERAEALVIRGLADEVIEAIEILTDDVLASFGLEAKWFWSHNPYFSTAHLAALHHLRNQADWMFFLNGDVWLDRPNAWVRRALSALEQNSGLRGLNLCRNVYADLYARCCQEEGPDLWISHNARHRHLNRDNGFSLSDHAYLLALQPEGGWNFACDDGAMEEFRAVFPAYAFPCFELLFAVAMKREGFKHAALKPDPGPVTKHRSFSKNLWKTRFYQALGRYQPGGSYAISFAPSQKNRPAVRCPENRIMVKSEASSS